MENFIIYMVKASGLLAVFFTTYYLLLRKETFFNSNRKFLLAGLVTSAILPLLVLTRTVWVEPMPETSLQNFNPGQLSQLQAIVLQPEKTIEINWYDVVAGVYTAGMVFFFIKFIIDINAVRKLLKGHKIVKEDGYKLIDSPVTETPFSFFNYIVYNSAILSQIELDNIFAHEKVHSRQKHSADMITGQLFCIMFWFNPLVWLYKKAIAQNLEFIADAEATKLLADKKAYQKTLLKITVQPECIAITNHFYQSLIKKRIVMLNKKKSAKRNSWKYAVVAPLLVAFMALFQVQVNAQVKEAESKVVSSSFKVALKVTKDSKDEELNAEKDFFKSEFDADLQFSNIKRNDKGEITDIKATLKSPGEYVVYQVSGKSPIKTFNVEIEKDDKGAQHMSIALSDNSTKPFKVLNATAHDYSIDINSVTAPPTPPAPSAVNGVRHAAPAPPVPVNEHWTVNNFKIGNDDMLVVINGVKQEKGEEIRLPLSQEIDKLTILDKKDAKKKYGKDGKKGAVEITTKTDNSRYTVHTINSSDAGPMQMYIGESGIDYEEMQNEISKMREFISISDHDLTEQLKALEGISAEELKAIKENIITAQEEVRKLGSGQNEKTFKFNEEQYKQAKLAMDRARQKMNMNRQQMQEERERQSEVRKQALEERRKKRESIRNDSKE